MGIPNRTIRYFGYNVEDVVVIKEPYTMSIDVAIMMIKKEIKNFVRVWCLFEPGDATRYEFGFIKRPDAGLFMFAPMYKWMEAVSSWIVPDYIDDKIKNTWTRHLFAEVIQRVTGGQNKFYNWKKAKPIILESINEEVKDDN